MAALPLFQLDADELYKLQEDLPRGLQILRLRLRFGLLVRVQLGQRFRVVVDLVDEMGKPIPKGLTPPSGIDISLATSDSTNKKSGTVDDDQFVLQVEDEVTDQITTQRQTKWLCWVSLHRASTAEDFGNVSSGASVNLRIQMRQAIPACSDSSSGNPSRYQLQSFCVGSSWLSEQVLVLPLQVGIKVTKENCAATTSTICERLFRSSPSTSTTSALNDKKDNLLVIEEDYGDTMGSHVWDASIVLSFAVIQAGMTNPKLNTTAGNTKQAFLELGSGCGLFAAVLATQEPSHAGLATIFTEKLECIERLQANLARNCSPASASALVLEWGTPLPKILREAGVRVVFAADVLYNWAAQEVFLNTLDSLVEEQESSTNVQVILAHKRRGKTSAAKLNALASGTFDVSTQCGTSDCRWQHWQVKKLSSVGRVDLFILSHCADKVASQQ